MRHAFILAKLVQTALRPFGVKLSRIDTDQKYTAYRPKYDLKTGENGNLDANVQRTLNLIEYTKIGVSPYAGIKYDSAYHSVELSGTSVAGQRNPSARLGGIDFDFSNKTVLDIGCNQGGMLFAVSSLIKRGIGIDYDYRMINAANRIRAVNKINNTDFYVFDLEKENLDLIDSFITDRNVDVVFLLSVCMWIKNWRSVIDKCFSLSENLLFETNGTEEQQFEQEDYIRSKYDLVSLIRDASDDDPRQKARRLFFCKRGTRIGAV